MKYIYIYIFSQQKKEPTNSIAEQSQKKAIQENYQQENDVQ